jgi:hypothetical protein
MIVKYSFLYLVNYRIYTPIEIYVSNKVSDRNNISSFCCVLILLHERRGEADHVPACAHLTLTEGSRPLPFCLLVEKREAPSPLAKAHRHSINIMCIKQWLLASSKTVLSSVVRGVDG